jgi:hypothetical protein
LTYKRRAGTVLDMEAVQGTDGPQGWSDAELETELRTSQVRSEQHARRGRAVAERRRIAVAEADRRDWTTYRTAKAMKADPGTVKAILAAAQNQEPTS